MRWVNWALHTALWCLLISFVKAFMLEPTQCAANEGREEAILAVTATGPWKKEARTATCWIERVWGVSGTTREMVADKTRSGVFIRNHRLGIVSQLYIVFCPPAASLLVKRHYVAAACWESDHIAGVQCVRRDVCVCDGVQSFQPLRSSTLCWLDLRKKQLPIPGLTWLVDWYLAF